MSEKQTTIWRALWRGFWGPSPSDELQAWIAEEAYHYDCDAYGEEF